MAPLESCFCSSSRREGRAPFVNGTIKNHDKSFSFTWPSGQVLEAEEAAGQHCIAAHFHPAQGLPDPASVLLLDPAATPAAAQASGLACFGSGPAYLPAFTSKIFHEQVDLTLRCSFTSLRTTNDGQQPFLGPTVTWCPIV